MPNFPGTTRAQSQFLRAFKTDPFGPEPSRWPSPAILRRWLRRPGFHKAMESLGNALRYQADFQLLSAAASTTGQIQSVVLSCDAEMQQKQLRAMNELLKLAHLRQRFAQNIEPPASPQPRYDWFATEVLDCLLRLHPDAPLKTALSVMGRVSGLDIRAECAARIAHRAEFLRQCREKAAREPSTGGVRQTK